MSALFETDEDSTHTQRLVAMRNQWNRIAEFDDGLGQSEMYHIVRPFEFDR